MNPRHVRLLIWKEFVQLRRDPMLLRLIFVMPIMQMLLFGYVVAAQVQHLPTAVVDLDRSPVSRGLDASFAASDYFDIRYRPSDETELRPLLDRGQAQVAIVIPAGTQARLDRGEQAGIGIIVEGSDNQTASIGKSYATRIIAEANTARVAATGRSGAGAPGIDARVRVVYNQSLVTLNSMIPGLIAAIVMISIMVIMSQAVVKERESGTLEQMFNTPITRGEYLAGKTLPYAVLASGQALLVALVGALWFQVPFRGSVAVAVLGLFLFLLTCLGLGLLISLVSHTRHQAQQTIMFVSLPMMILSGFIFPIQSMPEAIQPFTKLIPLTWALQVMRGVFIKGSGVDALATPLLVLAGFAVVVFGAAVVVMQRRLAE